MAKWTVLVIPENETDVRQYRFSREVIRSLIALHLFLFAAAGSIVGAAMVGAGASRADARLAAKNEVLERELEYLTVRLDTLHGSMEQLTGRDEFYRLLAGLEPLDPEVLMAGIGGPDAETLEASELYRLAPHSGRLAFDGGQQLSSLIRRAGVLTASWAEAEKALRERNTRLGAMPSIQPTRGYLSSAFTSSRWHPLLNRARPHNGIDIVAPIGTPVVATANGRVVSAGTRGHYGVLVEIDHGHGTVTRYAHLSRAAVKPGQSVQRGQEIGAVGNTGLSAGPHLHYEVLVNGRQVNPSRYILDDATLP